MVAGNAQADPFARSSNLMPQAVPSTLDAMTQSQSAANDWMASVPASSTSYSQEQARSSNRWNRQAPTHLAEDEKTIKRLHYFLDVGLQSSLATSEIYDL